jgi:hypothetical protein
MAIKKLDKTNISVGLLLRVIYCPYRIRYYYAFPGVSLMEFFAGKAEKISVRAG